MEEITYFDQEQQHLFSYADEIYDFQNIDGPSDFGSDNSDSYNDRISPPLDQVCIPYYDIDTKWRSVSVGNPSQLLSRSDEIHNDVANRGLTAPVDLKSTPKRPSNIYRIQVSAGEEHYTCNENTDDVARKQALDIKVPEEPYLLFLSHFETCVPFHRVSDLIERTFDQFPEISFEFVAGECVVSSIIATTHAEINQYLLFVS